MQLQKNESKWISVIDNKYLKRLIILLWNSDCFEVFKKFSCAELARGSIISRLMFRQRFHWSISNPNGALYCKANFWKANYETTKATFVFSKCNIIGKVWETEKIGRCIISEIFRCVSELKNKADFKHCRGNFPQYLE